MNLRNFLKTTALTLPLAIMVGCGGGGGGSSTPSVSTITGVLVDSAVSGVDYNCSSGATGMTNADGEFTCNVGDTVRFSMGGVFLGEVDASSHITPSSFFPNDPAAALNLAQLLQSLDSDNNASNGIVLDANTTALFVNTFANSADINFSSSTFDSDVNSSLPAGHRWVNENNASKHLEDTLAGLGINRLGGSDITAPVFEMNSSLDINETQLFISKILTDESASYTLSETSKNLFEIKNNDKLYFKELQSYGNVRDFNLTVIATDSGLNESQKEFRIHLLDLAPKQIFAQDSNLSIDEGSTIVYEFENQVYGQYVKITLEGEHKDKFFVGQYTSGTPQKIYLKDKTDFEDIAFYELTLVVADTMGNKTREEFTIAVSNLEESPKLESTVINIQDNAAGGTVIGNVVIADSGDHQVDRMELEGDDASSFAVENNGSIRVAQGATLSAKTYGFFVKAYSDTDGKTAIGSVTVNVEKYFGFSTNVDSNFSLTRDANNMSIADFNGDGYEDIIYQADGTTPGGLILRKNVSGSSFENVVIDSGIRLYSHAVADFDGDSDNDIVVKWNDSSNNPILQIYSNDGNGTDSFTSTTLVTLDSNIYSLVSADFDNDGDVDILTFNSDNNTTLYKNDGSANFSLAFVTPTEMGTLTLGDINGDGFTDFVVSERSVYWYENRGGNSFVKHNIAGEIVGGVLRKNLYLADMNKDGHLDLIMQSASKTISVYENNVSNEFTPVELITFEKDIDRFEVKDFNLDGDDDVLVLLEGAQAGYDGKYLYMNQGSNTFFDLQLDKTNEITVGRQYTADFKLLDYDKDGVLDVLFEKKLTLMYVDEDEAQ